jgi:hypothetical protein
VPAKPDHYVPRLSDSSSPRSNPISRSSSVRYPPQTHHTQGSADQLHSGAGLYRSASLNSHGLRRSGSITQRYPGDMSHRPLDMIKREARAADRAPHLRRAAPAPDTIDVLDKTAIGGAYHHGGPYDATLASRNSNKLYSPVEAVKESNMEAIKATPRAYIQDSLTKHVPLQGTATVPPGMEDMGGQVMNYAEGADLMREPDAPGGAYRRYDFIVSFLSSRSRSCLLTKSYSLTIPTILRGRASHHIRWSGTSRNRSACSASETAAAAPTASS